MSGLKTYLDVGVLRNELDKAFEAPKTIRSNAEDGFDDGVLRALERLLAVIFKDESNELDDCNDARPEGN